MMNENNKFKFIDLFSGLGAFHISAKQYGGKCVLIEFSFTIEAALNNSSSSLEPGHSSIIRSLILGY